MKEKESFWYSFDCAMKMNGRHFGFGCAEMKRTHKKKQGKSEESAFICPLQKRA
jgi:hypothetical protein